MTEKTGYFYLINNHLIGEAFNVSEKPCYEGHAACWEAEFAKLFPASPDIIDLKLCWYGCDRGRISCVDGQYIILGTKGIFRKCEEILKLYGFKNSRCIKKITDDDHYSIMTEDAELLKRNLKYFKPLDNYRYLIKELIDE